MIGCLDLSKLKRVTLWPGIFCYVMPEDERETLEHDNSNPAEDEDIPWDPDRNYEIGENDEEED